MTIGRHCIVDGHGADAVGTVRELFLEYAAWVTVDLCFQDFAAELATLPGKYAPPTGAILLAQVHGAVAGCVAMRRLEGAVGEMKRLWVRQSFRNCGIGKLLIEAIVERARAAGYARLRLDTLPQMNTALVLYRALDFYEVPAYYDNPVPGAIFLEKTLVQPGRKVKETKEHGN